VPLADLLPDSANVPEDGNITIDVLGNDNNVPATGTFAITQPTNGVVVINNGGTPNDSSDDTVTYTPNPNYNGPDSFTYTLCDVNNVCATETVSLTVSAVVDVYPDSITTLIETPVVVPVQNNDNDISTSNGSLTVTQSTNGVVSINNGGTPNNPSDDVLTYTPNDDFVGDDTF
jgi:large repetitive protein